MLHWQHRFLVPAISCLSHMADDPGIQRKMLKRVSALSASRHTACFSCFSLNAMSLAQDLLALLVVLLGHPCAELTEALLELLSRMAVFKVRADRERTARRGNTLQHDSAASRHFKRALPYQTHRSALDFRKRSRAWQRRASSHERCC